jgi:hypothetical protein
MSRGDTGCMTTRPSAPYLLRRIVERAGVGMWRNRGSMLFGVAVLAAMGGYTAYGVAGASAMADGAPAVAAPAAVSTSCADVAMAAVTDKSTATIDKAYDCMDPSFQAKVSQADFVSQLPSDQLQPASKISRVGDYKGPGGDTMVYYALDGTNQSVGYIVYLGDSGKVLRIQ